VSKKISGLPPTVNAVTFLDFSKDGKYFIYKVQIELIVVDMNKLTTDNSVMTEMNIEWMSDAIRITNETKGVNPYYSEENRILKMARLGESTLVVTDDIGTIRLFPYPCDSSKDLGFYRCYTNQMMYISNCVPSLDHEYLITTSEMDSSIYIWSVDDIT